MKRYSPTSQRHGWTKTADHTRTCDFCTTVKTTRELPATTLNGATEEGSGIWETSWTMPGRPTFVSDTTPKCPGPLAAMALAA